MELQFNKTIIPYLRTLKREVQTQELTQEVRLSDGMPDIGKILASWGQILLRGKQWNGGGAGANGGVMVGVLYEPEDYSLETLRVPEGAWLLLPPQCTQDYLESLCQWLRSL